MKEFSLRNNLEDKPDMSRLASAELVYLVCDKNSYSNLSFDRIFEKYALSSVDRSFASAIVYGTLSGIVSIDAIADFLSDIPQKKIRPEILSVIRTGIWQIFMSEKIPDSAACNESVKIAKAIGNRGAASFVNALLRSGVRNKQELREKFIDNPKKFHLKCNMPPELAGYFKKWFGEKRAVKISEAMKEPPLISIRINTRISDVEYVKRELEISGCSVYPGAYLDNALLIKTNGMPMEKFASFREGAFTVQDESAMLVSVILSPQQGDIISDVCAAPGGKTCHIAEIMENTGTVYALDINENRIKLINENCERLKSKTVKTIAADAAMPFTSDFPGRESDRVLADVPCSGLGILRKKPEIKINMTHERITGLYEVQKKIIENASELVKPGGYMVYSTCTLNPMENQERVMEFISEYGDEFEVAGFSDLLPEKLVEKDKSLAQAAKNGMITLMPDVHDSDGFFIAKIRRKKH